MDRPRRKSVAIAAVRHRRGAGSVWLPVFAPVQQPRDMKDYKFFDDVAEEFKQLGVRDKFTDI